MKGSLRTLLSTKDELLQMPAAELATCLLTDTIRHQDRIFPSEVASYVTNAFPGDDSAQAAMEALGWLLAEGLLVPDYVPGGFVAYRLSRAARQAVQSADINELVRARQILPKNLHPIIIEHAVPIFRSGSYDTAVAESFKQVEVLVRDASSLSSRDGVSLMQAAFGTNGVLRKTNVRTAEQDGTMHLFVGAVAVFRNPSAHQNLDTDSHQAAQLLVLASLLIETAEDHIREARNAGRI